VTSLYLNVSKPEVERSSTATVPSALDKWGPLWSQLNAVNMSSNFYFTAEDDLHNFR